MSYTLLVYDKSTVAITCTFVIFEALKDIRLFQYFFWDSE